MDAPQNKIIHGLFEFTILMKGINGLWEIAVGMLFFFFKQGTVAQFIMDITHKKIAGGHITANYLTNQANNFSPSTQHFIAFYFLFYGAVNIFLVVFLFKKKLWAYPLAIIFFVLFIMYQVYRVYLHHSGLLVLFTVFDAFFVLLTFLEYKRLKSLHAQSGA